jgi:hypothetical protein
MLGSGMFAASLDIGEEEGTSIGARILGGGLAPLSHVYCGRRMSRRRQINTAVERVS